jgi:signal transduction histidine kinase
MEIARAAGERLVDAQASAEIARRLMALQRQRLAEAQVIDQRTRRTLHDEVLPRLHAAMLELSASGSAETLESLAGAHRQIADLLHELPAASAPEVRQLGLLAALRAAAAEMQPAFDQVEWQLDPAAEEGCREIPPLQAEVIYYAAREAMRNAARHARGGSPLRLRLLARCAGGLELILEDNGVGMSQSAPAAEGGGQGLTLHSTMMAVIGGSLALESQPGEWTRVTLRWRGE